MRMGPTRTCLENMRKSTSKLYLTKIKLPTKPGNVGTKFLITLLAELHETRLLAKTLLGKLL